MPGGQPSTTQPIAGPWLSPKVVTRNRWPNVLNDMAVAPRPCRSLRHCPGQIGANGMVSIWQFRSARVSAGKTFDDRARLLGGGTGKYFQAPRPENRAHALLDPQAGRRLVDVDSENDHQRARR